MHPFIELFGFKISSYGAAVSAAIGATYFLTVFLGRRLKIGENSATTLLVAAIFGAFGGSKLLALIVEGKVDLAAGGVYYGGFIGVIAAILIAARFSKVPWIDALDWASPVGALGHFFGRLGCLFAGCCYGKPTESGVGVHFAQESVAYKTLTTVEPTLIAGDHTVPLIPTQLFEALFELSLAGLFTFLLLRKVRPGLVATLYCLLYGGFRFGIEVFRFDPERGYVVEGLLSTSQFISVALLAAGGFGLWFFVLRGKPAAELVVEEKPVKKKRGNKKRK